MRGIVDFRRAKLNDVAWWRRTAILIESMAKSDDRVILEAAMHFHGSLISNSRLEDASFKKHSEEVKALFDNLLATIRPWAHSDAAKQREKTLQGLVDAYKQYFPDPSDPEVKKAILDDHKKFIEERNKPPEETPEERIERLSNERDAMVRKRQLKRARRRL